MRVFLGVLGVLAALVVLRFSFFTVDPTEYVYVTQFGRHVATYDGSARDTDAGLHGRWPWPVQSVQRLDRRLQYFDLPGTELLTHDAEGKTIDKTLTVEAYVCWRIADKEAVDRFIRRLGSPDRARAILGQRLNSLLGATIGQMNLDDLITTERIGKRGKVDVTMAALQHLGQRLNSLLGAAFGQMNLDDVIIATERIGERGKVDVTMAALQQKLMAGLEAQAREEYGLQLVDIRLRRFNHPAQVRQSIFERIISERNKKVEYYRSEGAKQAANIRSAAEEKVRDLLAHARFEEEKLKGEADTEAAMIRNEAHSKDPEFYVFLKKLDKLQSILGDNKTTLLLSSHREIFELLFQPPRPSAVAGQGTPVPPGAAASPAPATGAMNAKQPVKGGG
jgi:membrane protease subunit HflC